MVGREVDGATRVQSRRLQASSHPFHSSTGKPATAPKRAVDVDVNLHADDVRIFNSPAH